LETLGEIRGFSFCINTKKGNYMDPITKALHETWKNIVTGKTNKLNENVHFANVKQDIDAGNSELADWHEDKYSGMWTKDNGIDRDANKAYDDLDQFNKEMETKYGKTEQGGYKTSLNDADFKRKQELEAANEAAYRRQGEREADEQERYTASVRKQEQEKRQNTARQELMKERGEKIRKGEDPAQLSPGDVTARERQLERQEREKRFDFITKPKSIMSTPTPGKTPYDDRAGDAPQPAKTPYDARGGSEDNVPTPTPKPTPGYDLSPSIKREPRPYPNYGDGDGAILKRAEERKRRANSTGAGPDRPALIIPIRTPAPQLAIPATTGSGLLNSVLNTNKKMYNSVISSLPSMPKIYEERDTEGQMAIGELKVLAQKAQELASMMKDDTQLEGWVQSKITKAKDYISSVHDYMNGNPDKID
jgi:hypothetical protein